GRFIKGEFEMEDVPMRHRPQQARSQERVDLILDTAAKFIAEVGYEAVTTNAIAERAGISVGSLYRYFSDKEAILRGLTVRHLEQVRAIYDQVFTEDLVYLPLEVVIDRIVDPFIELQVACPEFKQILLGSDVSADIAAASEQMDEEIVERLAGFLHQTAPNVDGQRARLMAMVCKAEVKALLSLVACDCGEDFRARLTAEMKRMLFNYLAPVFSGGEDAG
ncbi:MAG: TetR/AcrR family transcriptional regulator, partial [Anaerolineae bacterium]